MNGLLTRKPLTLAIQAATLGMTLGFATPALVYAEPSTTVEVIELSIPAGPLDVVLEQLARATGINLSYTPEQLEGKQAPSLNGSYSVSQALQIVLNNTGLMAEPNSGGYKLKSVSSAADVLSPVTVYGRQKNDTVEEIPQTVSVYDEESFNIGSSNTIGDILRLTPNATRRGSSLDMFADDYFMRGFDAEQSTNGLGFSRTDHPTDLANVERIEVLQGPSSVLYGQMEPGGTINVVTKQPLHVFQTGAGLEYGSHNRQRATLDVTGPFNDSVRGRLNLAYLNSESFVDFLEYRRILIAPNVTMDLTDNTNLTVEGSYATNEWTAVQGGTPIQGATESNPNGDYDKSLNPAWKDSFTDRDSQNVNMRLVHALTEKIDVRASYTYTNNESDWQEYAPFGLDEDDFRTLYRVVFVGQDTYKKDHDVILDLTGEFDTGGLVHKFIVGLNYRDTRLSRPTQVYFADAIDMYNPQYSAADLSADNLARDRTLTQDDEIIGVFIQDRVTVAENWHLLAGLRYTDSKQSQATVNHLNDNSAVRDSLSQTDWSTQLGVVYDLNDEISLYANRSESFVPQQGTTSGRNPLEAEESTQYELGVRFNVGDLLLNIAGFEITKENIAIEDPIDDDFEVAEGEARSRGVELSVGGYVASNWYLAASYGYTDTEILRSDDEDIEGNRFANIPLHTASIQTRYDISAVPGLSFGGAVAHLGDRFGDDDNSFELPSHTRVDVAAYYTISDTLQVDLLIDNVLDEEIFSPGSFDGVVREPERTFAARLKYYY